MSVVNGKDVVLSINRSGTYRAVACNAVCALHFERDFLETTFRDSGVIRTWVPFKGTITIDGSGPIELADAFTSSDVVDLWHAGTLVQWKFALTDEKNHDLITKEYTGYGYFRRVDITGDVQQAATCDYEILVSDDITGIDTGLVGSTEFFADDYTAVGGETFITNVAWIGAHMIEVLRNGIGLNIVSSGPSEGNQVLFDPVTGTLTFGLELAADEYLQFIWGV